MKIDRICSIQGSAKENEDSVDYKNQYFWIIDGATDLFNAKDSVFRLGDRKIWSDKRKNYGGVFCLELVKE